MKQKSKSSEIPNKPYAEDLVSEVKEDFNRRREERRSLEQQWNLNVNYLSGNQYCEISPTGDVCEEEDYYYWQNRNVYNHIAPIIETRLAKLSRVRPNMSVRAAGREDSDLKAAKIASDILKATAGRVELDTVISKATLWSETLGTSFYKVMWNGEKGKLIGEIDGEAVKEGDVDVIAVSPYEIYPDSLFKEEISDLKSLIHARVMDVDDIYSVYGVKVSPSDVDVFSLSPVTKVSYGHQSKVTAGVIHNAEIVIERYEKPSDEFPKGRIVTVAGDKVLNVCDLPYQNGTDGGREFPFIKQTCIQQAGMFFGTSIIERIIPLQRAYNAVKNRKHEFLNRISMGVVAVEDGSVDTDELSEEGLSPGKVIVYRQGSTPPQMISTGSVPIDFSYEEERLENEFITISGVSEISRNSKVPTTATSGVALQLLIEQDETRLSQTAENIRMAIKLMAKQIIRLFKQFAKTTRIMKIAGDGRKAEIFYYDSSDLNSDDVVFDTENELNSTPAQKKNSVFELLQSGILTDKDGRLSSRTKAKILEILGYGSFENGQDLTTLHINKASEENLAFLTSDVDVEEFDDHELHISEHTRYLLSGEISGKDREDVKNRAIKHLNEHKKIKQKSAEELLSKLGENK